MFYDRVGVLTLDRLAIEKFAIPGYELMTRAATSALGVLVKYWPKAKGIVIFCGTGKNGGDGFILARLAAAKGYKVKVYQVGEVKKILGDSKRARDELVAVKIVPVAWDEKQKLADPNFPVAVIVDAMLGTGLQAEVTGKYLAAIKAINAAKLPVLAIDVPSGLDIDTGVAHGDAVRSTVTVTFIGRKRGMYTGAARNYCGRIIFADLAVPAELYPKVKLSALRLEQNLAAFNWPARAAIAHKSNCGRVLVIGGDQGMPGAVCLASEAALRVGAGLVTVGTNAEHAAYLPMRVPEVMAFAVDKQADLNPLAARANVVLLGPGLGTSAWSEKVFKGALKLKLPMVIDADGLNLLADSPCRRDNWILTPHTGEAAKLLGTTAAAIEADRFAAIKALHDRYGGVIILKGAGTLIIGDGLPKICCLGNPAMATAGMGDILSGIVAGVLAQGMDLAMAADLGTYLHSAAADLIAATGRRGVLARDILAGLRKVLNGK